MQGSHATSITILVQVEGFSEACSLVLEARKHVLVVVDGKLNGLVLFDFRG